MLTQNLTQTLTQILTLIPTKALTLTQTLTQAEEKHYFASRGKITTSTKFTYEIKKKQKHLTLHKSYLILSVPFKFMVNRHVPKFS